MIICSIIESSYQFMYYFNTVLIFMIFLCLPFYLIGRLISMFCIPEAITDYLKENSDLKRQLENHSLARYFPIWNYPFSIFFRDKIFLIGSDDETLIPRFYKIMSLFPRKRYYFFKLIYRFPQIVFLAVLFCAPSFFFLEWILKQYC